METIADVKAGRKRIHMKSGFIRTTMTFARPVRLSGTVLYALITLSCSMGKYATGSYLRDVELIGPSRQIEHNTVYYYPSYVKGQDPVEEYNRRRLHVDTGDFMEQETDQIEKGEKSRLHKSQQQKAHTTDGDCCLKVKRKRKYARARAHQPKQHAPDPMRVVDAQTDHEFNYLKIRKVAAGVPRYVRDDVELFDIVKPENRVKEKRPPIRRRTRMVEKHDTTGERRRYEESDPQVFAYERSDVEPIERANSNHPGRPEDSQYFQYAEVFGDGSYAAGARRGNDQHYIEQLERGSHDIGVFQKKVKWADKKGGFGEHYWDLNHIQPSVSHR
uniref:Uncharacterized protein n=1 Tax=Anopheles christyi TaxID=43041 RepID=A0A182K7G1_9DIPT